MTKQHNEKYSILVRGSVQDEVTLNLAKYKGMDWNEFIAKVKNLVHLDDEDNLTVIEWSANIPYFLQTENKLNEDTLKWVSLKKIEKKKLLSYVDIFLGAARNFSLSSAIEEMEERFMGEFTSLEDYAYHLVLKEKGQDFMDEWEMAINWSYVASGRCQEYRHHDGFVFSMV